VNAKQASTIAGAPSIANIHCQPCSPSTPLMSRMIQPDSRPPSTPATATPAKNTEIAAARRFDGNQ
jgi:hypothetical protein